MRDIYLIDFENVASEGLSGITYLSEDDQVIIFYSNNSNRLTMKMHILIGKSVCKLDYFEVTVGGKNALDHQISTWLGYLIGTGAAERNYYIVSRDMGYKHVANFWAVNDGCPKVRCVDTIKAAGRLDRNRRENREPVLQAVPEQEKEVQEMPALTAENAVPEQPAAVIEILTQPEAASAEAPREEILTEGPVESEEASEAVAEEQKTEEHFSREGEDVQLQPVQESSRSRYRRGTNTRRSRNRTNTGKTQKDAEPKNVETVREDVPPVETKPEVSEHPNPEQNAGKDTRSAVKKPKEEKNSRSFEQLGALIAPYPKLQESVLRDLIVNNKRQILCNTLRKHLGQEKGLALYNEIKKTAWH